MALSFRTKNGVTCLNWETHAANAAERVGRYDHNHCRNPNTRPREKVWCYTGLGNTWDYCDVPWCLKSGQDMNTTVVEKEGIPVIITATIILGIVSFFLVIVIFLIVVTWCKNKKEENTVELISNSDSGIYSS